MIFPEIKTFELGIGCQEQTLKVLEKVAELVEAVKDPDNPDLVIYEFCDVLQALGNLAYIKGWSYEEIGETYQLVYRGNLERGLYLDTQEKIDKKARDLVCLFTGLSPSQVAEEGGGLDEIMDLLARQRKLDGVE